MCAHSFVSSFQHLPTHLYLPNPAILTPLHVHQDCRSECVPADSTHTTHMNSYVAWHLLLFVYHSTCRLAHMHDCPCVHTHTHTHMTWWSLPRLGEDMSWGTQKLLQESAPWRVSLRPRVKGLLGEHALVTFWEAKAQARDTSGNSAHLLPGVRVQEKLPGQSSGLRWADSSSQGPTPLPCPLTATSVTGSCPASRSKSWGC